MNVRHSIVALAVGCGAALTALAASAQTPAEFFRGKTVHLVVGSAAGAAYDFAGRAVGAHIGRFIPGNPTVVVENQPGAAGITMLNNLYNRAPRDGTVFGLPLNGVVLEPRLKALSREGAAVLFDLSKMSWIGSPAQQPQSIIVWKDAPFHSLADLRAKEAIFGTTSVGTDSNVMPLLLDALAGTKIKVVAGYQGVNDVFHAIEQGELQGASVLLSSFFGKPDWVRDGKARILLHFGAARIKSIPDVPTAIELIDDPDAKRMLTIYGAKFRTTYPFVLPPGVPADRVRALRDAFDAAMKDPQMIAEAKKYGIDVDPLPGSAIEAIMRDIDAAPQPLIDRLRKIIEP
jgi:tripartite-type tricarboxylate transporter receptor subunit TctC